MNKHLEYPNTAKACKTCNTIYDQVYFEFRYLNCLSCRQKTNNGRPQRIKNW